MGSSAIHNFHLPLPGRLQLRLREAASREGVPATAIARRALEEWLNAKAREALASEISRYAAEAAGGPDDLDPALETASIQAWLAQDRRRK
jgi:hypothetical protein